MKPTPGPWKADELMPDGVIIKKRGTYQISTPDYDVATLVPHGAPIRKEADARLIADAPALLETLAELNDALRLAWDERRLPADIIPAELVQRTSALIAKHTGKDTP